MAAKTQISFAGICVNDVKMYSLLLDIRLRSLAAADRLSMFAADRI